MLSVVKGLINQCPIFIPLQEPEICTLHGDQKPAHQLITNRDGVFHGGFAVTWIRFIECA